MKLIKLKSYLALAMYLMSNLCFAQVDCVPIPDFEYEIDDDGCTVIFTDASFGDITGYLWEFGDGATSTEANPSHNYNESGNFNVTLTVENGALTNFITKYIFVPSCVGDQTTTDPDCMINGATIAGAGTVVSLNGVGLGIPPYNFNWSYSSGVSAVSIQNGSAQFLIPETANNGDTYDFSVTVTDATGGQEWCIHTVTVSGNPPTVELATFGSFDPSTYFIFVSYVDVWNLTGQEQYRFTIRDGSGNEVPGSSSGWMNGDYDYDICHANMSNAGEPAGANVCLPTGNYTVCVDVKDDTGVYSDCQDITIGTPPPPPPPSPAMSLVVNTSYGDPTPTSIEEDESGILISITGDHPHPGFFSCDPERYRVDLAIEFLSLPTPITVDIFELDTYNAASQNIGTTQNDFFYFFGPYGNQFPDCYSGTVSITAIVYPWSCSSSDPLFDEPFTITTPLLIDIKHRSPKINDIIVAGGCSPILEADIVNGCTQSSPSSLCGGVSACVSFKTYWTEGNGCLVQSGTAIPPARQMPHCSCIYSKPGVTKKAILASSKSFLPFKS